MPSPVQSPRCEVLTKYPLSLAHLLGIPRATHLESAQTPCLERRLRMPQFVGSLTLSRCLTETVVRTTAPKRLGMIRIFRQSRAGYVTLSPSWVIRSPFTGEMMNQDCDRDDRLTGRRVYSGTGGQDLGVAQVCWPSCSGFIDSKIGRALIMADHHALLLMALDLIFFRLCKPPRISNHLR